VTFLGVDDRELATAESRLQLRDDRDAGPNVLEVVAQDSAKPPGRRKSCCMSMQTSAIWSKSNRNGNGLASMIGIS
jgi:hypothetical protein